MFTQLFGHYLLNNHIITAEQLRKALEAKNNTRAKLGALAIDAGYMTAEQVDRVHAEQRRVDKRIGDISVEMGFLTPEQVDELLSKQKTANIVIGQALIDLGYMTNQQFADALAEYKKSASFSDGNETDEELEKEIISVLGLDTLPDQKFYVDYILLLIRNCVRFVGDDFAFGNCVLGGKSHHKWLISQEIMGELAAYTGLGCDEKALTALASRYACEEITEPGEFAEACVGEFLNLQNGLFAVNQSNTVNVELNITPQTADRDVDVEGVAVVLSFSFGDVSIVIRKK